MGMTHIRDVSAVHIIPYYAVPKPVPCTKLMSCGHFRDTTVVSRPCASLQASKKTIISDTQCSAGCVALMILNR